MAEKKLKFDGALADQLGALGEEIKEKSTALKALEKQYSELEQAIVDNVPKDSTGIAGKKFRFQLVPDPKLVVDTVNDGWTTFYAFILKTKRPDLLQKRLSEGAVKEILESGKSVPGITTFTRTKVKVSRV